MIYHMSKRLSVTNLNVCRADNQSPYGQRGIGQGPLLRIEHGVVGETQSSPRLKAPVIQRTLEVPVYNRPKLRAHCIHRTVLLKGTKPPEDKYQTVFLRFRWYGGHICNRSAMEVDVS